MKICVYIYISTYMPIFKKYMNNVCTTYVYTKQIRSPCASCFGSGEAPWHCRHWAPKSGWTTKSPLWHPGVHSKASEKTKKHMYIYIHNIHKNTYYIYIYISYIYISYIYIYISYIYIYVKLI